MTQLALFDAPPAVDDYVIDVARNGLSHFRHLLRTYGTQWPDDAPEYRAWIAYFERMQRNGYAAAQAIKPQPRSWQQSHDESIESARHAVEQGHDVAWPMVIPPRKVAS